MNENEIRYAGIVKDSIVDGPGLRFTLFVQGCPHHCPGCHNPETHNFDGGKIIAIEEVFEEIKKDKGITGVTFSGGEPFSQAIKLIPLAKKIKNEGYNLASYSGYTFEQLYSDNIPGAKELLKELDILVDGKFDIMQRSLDISFRGSRNQRIIDVQKSINFGFAVPTIKKEWICKDLPAEHNDYEPKDIRLMGW